MGLVDPRFYARDVDEDEGRERDKRKRRSRVKRNRGHRVRHEQKVTRGMAGKAVELLRRIAPQKAA